jgi:predicted enzyme related to lactoylglutathione lyase
VFYIQVDDPQAYLDRIQQAGGKTVVPVTELPGLVTFAQFADPQGNVVGLLKST